MKAKKIFISILIGVSLLAQNLSAHAVACHPRWDGTRTVEANCDFPASVRIYGDVIVWPYTVTVPNWVVFWVNLVANKVTFTTWKILFQWTAKMDGSVATRYTQTAWYVATAYVVWWSTTSCPGGMSVLNAWQTWMETWINYVGWAWTMVCGYP